jgi:hypothetical protein
MTGNPSFKKRERERAQREKQQDKDRRRQERRDGKTDRAAANGEDPDLAGIVPGPQAPLYDVPADFKLPGDPPKEATDE